MTIDIDKIIEKDVANDKSDKDIIEVPLDVVEYKNPEASYSFDPKNDVQIVQHHDTARIKMSINANIPAMINRNIKMIRVIISERILTKLKTDYEDNESLYDFHFNVYDYYDIRKKAEIAKTKRIKTISLSNFSNSSVKYSHYRRDLIDLAVEKRSSLGSIFEKNNHEINKYFELNRELSKNNIIEASKETALMSHVITKDIQLPPGESFHVKIIELSSKTSGAFYEHLNVHSIKDFLVENNEVLRLFIGTLWEKTNKLEASGYENKLASLHEINLVNDEPFDNIKILEKSTLENSFSKVSEFAVERINENNYNIQNSSPAIYRVVDNHQKLRDVFIGDVKKHLFDSRPTIHTFSLEKTMAIVVKNVPKDFSHYIVYRYEESDRSKKSIIEVSGAPEINFFYENVMMLKDATPAGNRSYGYQIKFITRDNAEILTNISNRAKYIEGSGSFTLDGSMITDPGGDKIVFKTTAPVTDSQKIYDSVKANFPDIKDEFKDNLVENYSFLTFVKLMALDLKTGDVRTLDTKPTQIEEVEFNIENYGLDLRHTLFFGEMYANSIISIIENMNSSARFQNPSNDYIPSISYNISDLGLDADNFMSKFTSFSSINDGTLTYGRALANEPGNLIESSKTGVITIVNTPESTEVEETTFEFSKKLEIRGRNIPFIELDFTNKMPDSVLIVASSENGLVFRVEKSIPDNGEITFYDIAAKNRFLNEIIDYFIIPVYNNYNIEKIIKIGTVVCSKDNFRSI